VRRTWCIARREFVASVRTKGFLFGLLAAPVLMFGSGIAMVLLRHEADVSDKRVAVVDRAGGRLAAAWVRAAAQRNGHELTDARSGRKTKPAVFIEEVDADSVNPGQQRLGLSERIRRGELHAFVEVGPDVLHPGTNRASAQITYHAKSAALDDVRRWLEGPANAELRRLRLAEAGIDEARVPGLFEWRNAEPMGLVTAEEVGRGVGTSKRTSEIEAIAAPLIASVLMFMIVMMGASPLLGAVMEEKGLRVSEVLLGCATPFEMLMGKLLGSVGVALTGAVFYLGAGGLTLVQLGVFGYFPLWLVPWFLVYVVLAILMVGAISTALGATCNDAKDAQHLALPALLPVLVPMFLLGPVLKEPHSAFATWVSLVPPLTPILMLLRQSTPGGVPAWQPVAGLAAMVCFTWFSVAVAARVFRVGLLMQGQPPSLRNLVRWAVRG
jgi:ABC-2 type transport system permease protein